MKNIFLSVFLILILLTCATPNVIFADGPPWLGVNMKDSIDGVLIINVVKDSPAEAAGISVNDVIIGYHNRRIQTAQELSYLINITPVGKEVEITVLRDGERIQLTAVIGERVIAQDNPYQRMMDCFARGMVGLDCDGNPKPKPQQPQPRGFSNQVPGPFGTPCPICGSPCTDPQMGFNGMYCRCMNGHSWVPKQ